MTAIPENIGQFYLGTQILPDAGTPVLYDAADLTTHAVIIGMTGSGKTGLGITLLEEAALDGAVEADSSADVLDAPGCWRSCSCEGEGAGSAAETVDGLAGVLIPEIRSTLIRSPQSRVLALILQLRLCPATSSGTGTCQAA